MISIKKLLLTMAVLLSVSFCSSEDKQAIMFVKHLTNKISTGKKDVEYWTKEITELEKEHPKEAEALKGNNMNSLNSEKFLKELERNLNLPNGKDMGFFNCKIKIFVIRSILSLHDGCKKLNEKKDEKEILQCLASKIEHKSKEQIKALETLKEKCVFKKEEEHTKTYFI